MEPSRRAPSDSVLVSPLRRTTMSLIGRPCRVPIPHLPHSAGSPCPYIATASCLQLLDTLNLRSIAFPLIDDRVSRSDQESDGSDVRDNVAIDGMKLDRQGVPSCVASLPDHRCTARLGLVAGASWPLELIAVREQDRCIRLDFLERRAHACLARRLPIFRDVPSISDICDLSPPPIGRINNLANAIHEFG
jgi:hypothetical protein